MSMRKPCAFCVFPSLLFFIFILIYRRKQSNIVIYSLIIFSGGFTLTTFGWPKSIHKANPTRTHFILVGDHKTRQQLLGILSEQKTNRHRRPSWTTGSPTSHLKAWLFNTCVGVHGKCARIAGQDLRDFAQTSGMESKSQDGKTTSLSLVGFCRCPFWWPKKTIYGHLRTSYDIQIWNNMYIYIYSILYILK